MSPDATRAIICSELGLRDLSELFEWVDLEAPLGAASIAQVGGLGLGSLGVTLQEKGTVRVVKGDLLVVRLFRAEGVCSQMPESLLVQGGGCPRSLRICFCCLPGCSRIVSTPPS